MAVLVIGVGGLIGDADRKIGKERRDQIQCRVRGFGENSQAACGDATTIFPPVMTRAATTEFPATARFSARMAFGE